MWNITNGSFGGPKFTREDLPAAIESVLQVLLKHGCKVGFGDPDQGKWNPIEQDPGHQCFASQIASLWDANPKQYEFLVFAIRDAESSLPLG
jgi:hypothetical protein